MLDMMQLILVEVFVLVCMVVCQLWDVGVGVELLFSFFGGLVSWLGLVIKVEFLECFCGFILGECFDWEWDLMIGGVMFILWELECLSGKCSFLVRYKGVWIELWLNDFKNVECFCGVKLELSFDDVLWLMGMEGELLMWMLVYCFEVGLWL